MSSMAPGGYRFALPAQWKTCLHAQADTGAQGIRPLAPYRAQPTPTHASDGAFAPAVSPAGELLWRDAAGRLHRAMPDDDLPEVLAAPGAIARAMRLVATTNDYWVVGLAPGTLEVFEAATFARRFVVRIDNARVIDVAAWGRDAVAVLFARDGCLHVARSACDGTVGRIATLHGLEDALGFTMLAAPARFVVLAADGQRLVAFGAEDGRMHWRLMLPTLAPCFAADAIGGDGRARVVVAGEDGMPAAIRAHVLVLDAEGVLVDDVDLAQAATGVCATRDALLATGAKGLYRLARADTVPDEIAEVRALLLTPMLEAPDVADQRRWLRVEAVGDLPAGATLEIAWASTDDTDQRDRVLAIANDASMLPGHRLQKIRALEEFWSDPMCFSGSATSESGDVLCAAPLHDVRGRFAWVSIAISAGAGARLPLLRELRALYPGRTLMEQLPSIYQREESRPGSFLRSLVGVLETTTQDLDARIAMLGANIHPLTATDDWLDYVARWLGLPWDDALDLAQKRELVAHAEAIAAGRGTRAGLQAFLDAIVKGSGARYHVGDATADYGMAIVGGGACDGSALPAMLGGLAPDAARLGVRATLGMLHLPCNGAEQDASSRFLGRVRVDIAASAALAALWSPWLATLIQELLPVNTTLRLRWLGADALDPDAQDGILTLDGPPGTRLGTDAITGRSQLPDRGGTLPATSTDNGPTLH